MMIYLREKMDPQFVNEIKVAEFEVVVAVVVEVINCVKVEIVVLVWSVVVLV